MINRNLFDPKKIFHEDQLFFKSFDRDYVLSFNLIDSSETEYTYKNTPFLITDYVVHEENIYLFFAETKTLVKFDLLTNTLESEIKVNPESYEIVANIGESLFHYNHEQKLFYIGLNLSEDNNIIRLIGAFDIEGKLQFTFGDIENDNEAARPGYVLTNGSIKSKIYENSLYILKKETNNFYQFDLKGELLKQQILPILVIPKTEKVKTSPGVLKDQVMDFYVDEEENEMVYTYMTNKGSYLGEKQPDTYIAFKKLDTDTVYYCKNEFIDILGYENHLLSTKPFNFKSETTYFNQYSLRVQN